MRIPPTMPLPRAKSALRFGVRRWGIRFRAQRSEHGNGPPAAAGIMSTATNRESLAEDAEAEEAEDAAKAKAKAGDYSYERASFTSMPAARRPGK